MKRYLIPLVLAFMFVNTVSAQVATPSSAGLTPTHPLYFLDKLGEKIVIIFAWSPERKAGLALAHAAERVAEVDEVEAEDPDHESLVDLREALKESLAEVTAILASENLNDDDLDALLEKFDDIREVIKDARDEDEIDEDLDDELEDLDEAFEDEELEIDEEDDSDDDADEGEDEADEDDSEDEE